MRSLAVSYLGFPLVGRAATQAASTLLLKEGFDISLGGNSAAPLMVSTWAPYNIPLLSLASTFKCDVSLPEFKLWVLRQLSLDQCIVNGDVWINLTGAPPFVFDLLGRYPGYDTLHFHNFDNASFPTDVFQHPIPVLAHATNHGGGLQSTSPRSLLPRTSPLNRSAWLFASHVRPAAMDAADGSMSLHHLTPFGRQLVENRLFTCRATDGDVIVPTEVVYGGGALLHQARTMAVPQIRLLSGVILHPRGIPVATAAQMNELEPNCSYWFALPETFLLDGSLNTFPFALVDEPTIVRLDEASAFDKMGMCGVPTCMVPLSSIAEADRPLAAFTHEYRPMTIHLNHFQSNVLELQRAAFHLQYKSLVWVSMPFVERYHATPRKEDVAVVEASMKDTVLSLMCLDELEPLTETALWCDRIEKEGKLRMERRQLNAKYRREPVVADGS